MKNAYITTGDPIVVSLYDKEMVIEYFGEDFLKEWGHEVPDDLVERYNKNQIEFKQIQNELKKIKDR